MQTGLLREKPTLLLNRGAEDREASRCVVRARIPCEFVAAPADSVTPVLLFGLEEFVGLAEIRQFVQNWLKAEATSQARAPDGQPAAPQV